MHRVTWSVLLLMIAAALTGCESRDPYKRTDVWRPTGANAGNIAAMAANPRDLIRGHDAARSDTRAPELAVEHVWQDQPKPLLSSGGGQINPPAAATPSPFGGGGAQGGVSGGAGSGS